MVAIVGRPNAGKSTLMNALVGEKLAITAPQAQTTRTSLQGVLTERDFQIVFVDTPGIHKSDNLLNRRMMEIVRSSLQGRDVVLFLADATKPLTQEDEHALSALPEPGKSLLVLNKIDRVEDKRLLLPLIEQYQSHCAFHSTVPISARKKDGLDELKRTIVALLPESETLYDEDHLTDQPMRFMAAEIIREHILRSAREEVPHAAAVLVDNWEEMPALVRISATIYVERTGQKTILIGAKGSLLKTIGTRARIEIEKLVQRKVFLSLFVKIKAKWREDSEFLNAIDWRASVGNEASEEHVVKEDTK
jgi:GTPase